MSSVANDPDSGTERVVISENFRGKIRELENGGRYDRFLESLDYLDSNIRITSKIAEDSKDEKIRMKAMEQVARYISQREEMLKKIPHPPTFDEIKVREMADNPYYTDFISDSASCPPMS